MRKLRCKYLTFGLSVILIAISFHSSIASTDSEAVKWAVIITAGSKIRDARDANELYEILLNHGWDKNNIKTLIEEEATREAVLNAPFEWLEEMGEDENDIILFFFSMHGAQIEDQQILDEPDGKDEYLIPYDFDMENKSNFILDDELSEKFDTLKSRNIVIIFETCHSGGMIDGSADFGKSGYVVLASCGINETSYPIFIRMRWMFPYYLIKGFKGYADTNNDGWVSAEEAFYYAEKSTFIHSIFSSIMFILIPLITLHPQHPQIYDGWPSKENNEDELNLIKI